MLKRKLWRTAKVYKVQFISMILLIALGIGVFVGFNAEWVTIGEDTGAFFKDCGFLSTPMSKIRAISLRLQ